MPVITSCPDCGRQLRVPDDLIGKKVKCPGCKTLFTASSDEEPLEEVPPPPPVRSRPSSAGERIAARRPALSRDDDEERPPSPRDDADDDEDKPSPSGPLDNWRRVRDGIGYILTGLFITIGAAILGTCGGIAVSMLGVATAASAGRSGGAPSMGALGATFGMVGVVYLLEIVGIFVGLIYMLVGHAFCMVVPEGKGKGAFARGLAIASFSGLTSIIGGWASGIVFLFFLWSMAHQIRRPDLAATVRTYLYSLVFVTIGGIGLIVISMLVAALSGFFLLPLVVYAMWGLANLCMFVWYVILLFSAKSAVTEHIGR